MSHLKEDLFRKLVRELIKQELDEANSTASAGGEYSTPHAFKGSNKKGKKKGKAGYEGGHTEPTDGTGHFIADDPKLRKESINEQKKRDSQNLVKEFGKSFQKFTRAVHMLGKSMTKITGDRTDEKIIQKAFKKHIIPFGRLIDSWNETQQKNPHLNEGRYHAWRNDDSLTPKQKIGMAMRETRDNLTELERVVRYNVRLKNELNVDSRDYWKNTHKALSKISERLVRLANKVGQLH